MPARRFLMLVKEEAWGVPMEEPTAGTDSFYLRLGDGTDLGENPIIQEVPYGGGRTTAACAWSDQGENGGTLNTLLYPGQAPLFLHWWLTNINTGRTTPWATDNDGLQPPGDVASVSIYEAIQESDGSYTRKAYRGCKVNSGTLSAQQDGAARAWQLALQIMAGAVEADIDTEEFPDPAETDYPCGPYLYSHLSGGLKIATTRNMVDSVSFSADNGLEGQYFVSKAPLRINSYGRNTTLSVGLARLKSPDDFADFKAVIAKDTELTLNNGTKSVKIDLHTNNHWQTMGRRLPDGSYYAWDGVLKNKWDASQGTDLTVTAA